MPAKKLAALAATLALLTLAACGFNGGGANGDTHSDAVWTNPHPDKHNLASDRYSCMQEAAQSVPVKNGLTWNGLLMPYSYDMNAVPRDKLFTACMNSKEWVQQP